MIRLKKRAAVLTAVLLAAACVFNVPCPLNAAQDDTDIGIIGLSVRQNEIRARLYNYGSAPVTASKVSYYIDGKFAGANTSVTVPLKSTTEAVLSCAPDMDAVHHYSVVIAVEGDVNESNNNATGVVRASSGSQNPPDANETTAPVSGQETGPETETETETASETESESETATESESESVTVSEPEPETETESETPSESKQETSPVETTTADTSPEPDYGELQLDSFDKPSVGELVIGEIYTLRARVRDLLAPAVGEIHFYVDGVEVNVQPVLLDAGEEQEYTFDWTVTSGNHTFKAVVTYADGKSHEIEWTVETVNVPGEEGKSDLVVTDVFIDPENPGVGEPVTFTAIVKNQGTATTQIKADKENIIGVRFGINAIDGKPLTWCDNFRDQPLGPGQSVRLTANGGEAGASWTPDHEGIFKVVAWADDQGRVDESDTSNNEFTKEFTVSTLPPLEVPDGDTAGGTVRAFDVPSGKSQTAGIAVTADNQTVGVFNTTVNNSRIFGDLRYQDTPVAIFEFEGSVNVRIATEKDVKSAIVRPLSAGIKANVSKADNGLTLIDFTLDTNGSFTVEFNGEAERALHLFANPITQEPEGSVIRIPAGTQSGSVTVGNGQTLYIEGGAAVYGDINLESGAQVVGSGIIEPGGAWGHITVSMHGKSNIHIEGVTIVNAPSWTVEILDSSGIYFDYFHIISATENSDGISIQSSNDVHISRSFLRTWDDGVVLKNYTAGNYTHDIYVDHTVFWTDLAQSMEIGAETNKGNGGGPSIKTVRFENIDVIHSMHKPAISIHNMDNAEISDVKYTNITIEDVKAGYNMGYGDGWPLFLDITNVAGGEVPGTAPAWTTTGARGSIHGITLENITVLEWANDTTANKANDGAMGQWQANVAPGVRMLNSNSGGSITDVTITDMTVGGVKITGDNIGSLNSWIGGYGDMPQYTIN